MGTCPSAPMESAVHTDSETPYEREQLVPSTGGTVFQIDDHFAVDIVTTAGNNTNSNCVELPFPFGFIPYGAPEEVEACQTIATLGILPDPRAGVWFKMTVDSDCEVDININTCDTDKPFDTAIAVYEAKATFDCNAGSPNLFDTLQCINGFGAGSAADDSGTCTNGELLTDLELDTIQFSGLKEVYVLVYSGNNNLDGDLGIGPFKLEGTVKATPGSRCGGDPHFSRWRHDTHDSFHGECDLVLLHSDNFHQGTGMDVHVRTTMMDNDLSYSYVEAAAVRIGETVLEFDRDMFRVNGENLDYDAVQLFEFEEQGRTYKISSEVLSKTKRDITLQLDARASIKIRSSKNLMYVDFEGSTAAFADSVGMLGNYKTGDMYGRNGKLFEQDYVQYGFEWQVDPQHDPVLFADQREPQLPYEKCRLPLEAAATSRRRLRTETSSALRNEAMEACQTAVKTDFELCVDDVMATGNIEAADMFV
eukprot:scaffold3059_cov131-Amphora_coffeaeformis.AAC.7